MENFIFLLVKLFGGLNKDIGNFSIKDALGHQRNKHVLLAPHVASNPIELEQSSFENFDEFLDTLVDVVMDLLGRVGDRIISPSKRSSIF
jgi:hypothetical protein